MIVETYIVSASCDKRISEDCHNEFQLEFDPSDGQHDYMSVLKHDALEAGWEFNHVDSCPACKNLSGI